MSSQLTGVSAENALSDAQATTPPVLRRRNTIETWVFLIPALVLQLTWGWYPLVMGFILSFTDGQIIQPPAFVGLANYTRMLSDPITIQAFRVTLTYSLMSIILTFITPIIVAIFIMEMPRRITYIMMFLWFLPLSGITNILLWRYVYNEQYGLLENFVTGTLHLPHQQFLNDPHLVLFWIIFPGLLLFGPGLLYMATLQGIPNSYFEAAEVEGASFFRKIWTITIPRLRPIIFLTLLLAIVGVLQPFQELKLYNNGDPAGESRSVMMYVYDLIQNGTRIGDAAALSGVIFIFSLLLAVIFRLVFKDDPDA
jgi:multiple sugar transport system permease protein